MGVSVVARRVGDGGRGGEEVRRGEMGGSSGTADCEERNLIGFRYDFKGGGRTLKYMLKFLRARFA
jgi:hypothetical protein